MLPTLLQINFFVPAFVIEPTFEQLAPFLTTACAFIATLTNTNVIASDMAILDFFTVARPCVLKTLSILQHQVSDLGLVANH